MTIREMCQRLPMTDTTLRYYEKAGLLHRISRISGRRDYTEADYERVCEILRLRRAGVPLKTISNYFALADQGEQTADARRELLLCHRSEILGQIETRRQQLNALDRLMGFIPSSKTSGQAADRSSNKSNASGSHIPLTTEIGAELSTGPQSHPSQKMVHLEK